MTIIFMGFAYLLASGLLTVVWLFLINLQSRCIWFVTSFSDLQPSTIPSPSPAISVGNFVFRNGPWMWAIVCCKLGAWAIFLSKIFFSALGSAQFYILSYINYFFCVAHFIVTKLFWLVVYSFLLFLFSNKFAFSILAGKSPFGQLPVLEIKDAASSEPIVLCQSVAILRYLSNEFGMYLICKYFVLQVNHKFLKLILFCSIEQIGVIVIDLILE